MVGGLVNPIISIIIENNINYNNNNNIITIIIVYCYLLGMFYDDDYLYKCHSFELVKRPPQ